MHDLKYRLASVLLSIILVPVAYLTAPLEKYIDESTTQGVAVFGVARMVNAGVSVIQSAEGSAIVASARIGEALDPVDDMIESFSSVMMWAIGGLYVQRFALSLVKIHEIGMLISAIGGLAVLLGIFKFNKISLFAWRIFVSTLLVRLGIIASIYLSMLISNAVLRESIDAKESALSEFNVIVDKLTGREPVDVPASDQLEEMKSRIESGRSDIEKLEVELEQLETKYSQMPSPWPWENEDPLRSKIGDEISDTEKRLDSLKDLQDSAEKEMRCIEAAISGGSCQSLFGRIRNVDLSAISDILAASSAMINSLILLSAAFALKSILLPILSMNFILRSFWRSAAYTQSLLT